MAFWHDESDSLQQLIQDCNEDSQPFDVSQSAKQELLSRGYSEEDIRDWAWKD